MLESKIERDSVKAASAEGWLSFKLLSQLNKGLPDRMFIKDGNVVFIEYKQPGKAVTPLQNKMHQLLTDHGASVYVAHSVAETMEILNDVK